MKETSGGTGKEDHGICPGRAAGLPRETLKKALEGSLFSSCIVLRRSVDSTNSLARKLGRGGAPEGTLVLAEEQTAGRGRRGRSWISPRRGNLHFSVLLRPSIETEKAFTLTMILALAASDAVSDLTGLRPKIKWPNDLYLVDRKLGGILTEFAVKDDRIAYMVLGLGLNVNWSPERTMEMKAPATNILRETGLRMDLIPLLASILRHLEGAYRQVLSGKEAPFHERWNTLSTVLGRAIEIESRGEILRGRALRINERGALIFRDRRGREREILNGDVSLRPLH